MSGDGPSPRVSVVVATRNRAERLRKTLHALAGQEFGGEFEVVVVDDCSTDQTAALLKNWSATDPERLRFERRSAPGGPAGARNSGWKLARAPLIAFTDDDCEPSPGWLSGLLEVNELAEGDVLIQGPTRPNPSEASRIGPFSRTLEVESLGPWYPACNVAYPRTILERLRGFDEALPRGEDTDLAWRAHELGVTPKWAANAEVWHAVMQLGPVAKLRLAAAWAPAFRNFKRHPALRAELFCFVFWKRSHASFLLAGTGLALGRRFAPALLLAIPYAAELRRRTRPGYGRPAEAAFHALHDAVEIGAALSGSVRARTFVL